MESGRDDLRTPEAQRAWERVLRPLAAEVAENAGDLSRVVLGRIAEQVPELFADAEGAEGLRASTEASIRAFAAIVEERTDPRAIELPVETLAYAHEGVRRGVPLASLMRSYRVGQAALWEILRPQVGDRAESQDELSEALAMLTMVLFAYIDEAVNLAEEEYGSERERWARSAAAVQAETIDAILGGRQSDTVLAGRRLRYELERRHVGALAWLEAPPENGDPLDLLEAGVGQVAIALGATSRLVRPLGALVASAWLTVPAGAPSAEDLRLDAAVAPGVRIALGKPASGVAGFRRTHGEAAHARRVAMLAGRSPGSVTTYGRVSLAALATVDLDQASAFVADELGPLLSDDDTVRRLAATLRVFLDEHGSRTRAARRLGLHENTISYRIRQAEELLGRSVEEDTIELHVALVLAGVVPRVQKPPRSV